MKKAIVIGFVSFVLSLPATGRTASVGNNADTQGGLGKFSVGIEYDGAFDRDMDFKSGTTTSSVAGVTTSSSYPSSGRSIKDMKASSNRVFLKGSVGLHPNIDLFLKLGMANTNWKYTYVSPSSPDEKFEFNGNYGFAWGIGAKAKIFETSGGLRLITDAGYMTYKVDGKLKVNGQDVADYINQQPGFSKTSYNAKTTVNEWQVALYVNQTFGQFSPYAGVKYSNLQIKNDTDVSTTYTYLGSPYPSTMAISGEAKSKNNIGVLLGTDIYIIPNQLSVNVEGRLLDETAATIGATYKF